MTASDDQTAELLAALAARPDAEWAQWNVTADSFDWAALARALDAWREEGLFERFFFVRKPPGLRLRFAGPNVQTALAPRLEAWLEDARRDVYEPEQLRFGGPAGMAVAHEQFAGDAARAIAVELLGDADGTLRRELYSIFALNHLFLRALEDLAEVAELWSELSELTGAAAAEPLPLELIAAVLELPPEVAGELSGETLAVLQAAQNDAERVAALLDEAFASGAMHVGRRRWLAAVAIFHWNRLGFTLPDLQPMIAGMTRFLESR